MIVLTGLPADNLLGFLAALGVCRITGYSLSWKLVGPREIAALDADESIDDLADQLLSLCRRPPAIAECSDKNLNLELGEWSSLPDEWASTIACQTRDGFARSPLLTCGSNGRQVTTNVLGLSRGVAKDDIVGALAGPWIYRERFGMQWDPAEYRVAGERWRKPGQDDSCVAWGPTRLAIEGLPLWPTLTDRRLSAVRYVTWREPLTPAAVRGRILAGVGERVYECNRIRGSKGRVSFDVTRAVG